MRSRIVLLFALALICAAGAAYLVMKKVQQMHQPTAVPQAASVAPQPTTTLLLVATRDLPSGAVVGPADTRAVAWPVESVPPGGMPPDSIAFGETVVRIPIAQNAPIIDTQIVRKGAGGALAYVVPPGRVALSINVDMGSPSTSVAGHVAPGNFVDILYVHSIPSEITNDPSLDGLSRVAETLLVGVKVLAVDQLIDDVNPEARVTRTVTVEVSPKEAEILLLAGSNDNGGLTLALNSAIEPSPADLLKVADVRRGIIPSYTTQSEISAVLSPPPSLDEPDEGESEPVAHKVYVFRGAVVQEVSLPAAGMKAATGGSQPDGGTPAKLQNASGPSSAQPEVEAQGDADETPAVPSVTKGSSSAPQSLLPEKLNLSGGSS